jgi:hypothetical protein
MMTGRPSSAFRYGQPTRGGVPAIPLAAARFQARCPRGASPYNDDESAFTGNLREGRTIFNCEKGRYSVVLTGGAASDLLNEPSCCGISAAEGRLESGAGKHPLRCISDTAGHLFTAFPAGDNLLGPRRSR